MLLLRLVCRVLRPVELHLHAAAPHHRQGDLDLVRGLLALGGDLEDRLVLVDPDNEVARQVVDRLGADSLRGALAGRGDAVRDLVDAVVRTEIVRVTL